MNGAPSSNADSSAFFRPENELPQWQQKIALRAENLCLAARLDYLDISETILRQYFVSKALDVVRAWRDGASKAFAVVRAWRDCSSKALDVLYCGNIGVDFCSEG